MYYTYYTYRGMDALWIFYYLTHEYEIKKCAKVTFILVHCIQSDVMALYFCKCIFYKVYFVRICKYGFTFLSKAGVRV